MYVYADNAATTKLSEAAKMAMLPYFDELYANPSSIHSSGQKIKDDINQARQTVADVIGAAQASEITFTSGGTESDNQAIISAATLGAERGKKHIISSSFEHHAVLHTLNKLKKQGFEITLIDPDPNGIVSGEKVAAEIREDTALVSIMYANNEIGTIQPITEIGAVCRKNGVLFHTDAVQAACHLHIDVQKQNIDLLSFSAHKFHGPKGIGGLYARRGTALSRLIEGGGQEKSRRPGTENVPGIIGLAAAIKEAYENIDKESAYLLSLRDKILNSLLAIPGSRLNGDLQNRLSGNISISFEGLDSESLILLLDNKGISVSNGSACNSASTQPSHVLRNIGVPKEYIRGTLRITLGRYNTEEEADYIIANVTESVNYLRSFSPVWKNSRKEESSYAVQ